MITILRKIRQKLISENRTSKYLLYAIGEILLVVIGILIALQVNNWSEKNKMIVTEYKVIKKLKVDLAKDIRNFNHLDSIYETWHTHANYIVENILNGKTKTEYSSEDFQIGAGSMYNLTVSTSTYDEMINTGLLYQLDNDELSEKIIDYYNFSSTELEKINLDNQNFYRYLSIAMSTETWSVLYRLSFNTNVEYINVDWLKDPNSLLYKELEIRIYYFRSVIEGNLRVLKSLRANAMATIQKLNDYEQQFK